MDALLHLGKLLLIAIAGIVGALVVFLAAKAVILAIRMRPRRGKEAGFEYIYVNTDGTARELDEDEIGYLSTEFHGADGNRPYIKLDYEELTPDGNVDGYLRRRQLPKQIDIAPTRSD